ncbi:MAG: chemotaxis protein CheW [Firmicutes bacterium]|nr:chemotaxis protein CheW [Bacillota bacterium]
MSVNAFDTEDIVATPDENESATIERFLTFTSDNITFGVSTNNVIEIISSYMIRSLPMVPSYIKGIINLRGMVIPVIDLRMRMGKLSSEYTDSACIIVLEIDDVTIGVLVDSVTQVLDIDTAKTSPVPVHDNQELASSMISLEDGTVVLFLNCEQMIQQ